MTKPVPDKAEIALEYPEKLYVGTFERSSRFEAHLDTTGFALILDRPGDEEARRSIHMHINYGLFASILSELASTVSRIPKDDIVHRDQLARAAAELHRALVPKQMRALRVRVISQWRSSRSKQIKITKLEAERTVRR